MKNFTIFFFFFSVVSLLIQPSFSATILIDGGFGSKATSSVHVGDSIIFEHKNSHYNLYIFKNKNAFDVCNFTQATILTKPNSTSYTWHPSRPGFYYFSFNNGTALNTCQKSQKLAVQVLTPRNAAPAPNLSPAPISGDPSSSSSSPPQYPWPFRPHQKATSLGPTSTTTESAPMTVPSLLPGKSGGIPFINSNPVVPLPTGEVDSATILPLSTSSGYRQQVMVGLLADQVLALFSVFLSLMVLVL